MTIRNYQVSGMTCGHCVSSVTSELSALPGVHGVTVDLETGRVTVTSSHPLGDEQVAAAIDEAGYQLAS